MVLHEFGKNAVGGSLSGRATEIDRLCQVIIFPEDLNWTRSSRAEEATPVNICSHADLMRSEPLFLREFIIFDKLKLLASPGPHIEVIAAPALRCDEHVRDALPLGIAVKSRVLRYRGKNISGLEFISIRHGYGHAALIQIVRRCLGNQGADVN